MLQIIFEIVDTPALVQCTKLCRRLRYITLDVLKKKSITLSGNVKYSDIDPEKRILVVLDEITCWLPQLCKVGKITCENKKISTISLKSLTTAGAVYMSQCNSLTSIDGMSSLTTVYITHLARWVI